MPEKEVVLTVAGLRKLEAELDYLKRVKRREIAERIKQAIEYGDISENSEYDDAKNEQAFVEGRIKELEILLATARVVDEPPAPGLIQVGSKVTIREEGMDDEECYVIVGAAEANPSIGRISNESPLGRALLNHQAGDTVQVEAPAGSFTVHVIKVE